ncbi:nucleoside triphosphate pyrophosphohydrolase [Candidatus Poribacteria bacterium]|nr:MAG: nucleoside triphosphate pyrophosphohydrolase [Candidatus Poribacteria bacterium]
MQKELFESLVDVIATLRGENGCPWDREQTHTSLKSTLIEETYETVEAIDSGDSNHLKEELGDLLLNIMLQAQIADESENFDIYDVIESLTEKLIRRHPHVFGNVEVENADEVVKNWESIKSQEEGFEDRKSVLDGIPNALPSLLRSQKIQKRAARVGFDWENISDVFNKVVEELDEVNDSIKKNDQDEIELEIGDLLFSVVNLCRFVDLHAEETLRKANRKFVRRFKRMETELNLQGKNISDQSLEELDRIWEKVKKDDIS